MDRYAILSNVNGNEEALDAVLNDIKQEGIRTVIFLGDSIGFGPNSIECLSRLKGAASVYLRGRLEYVLTEDKQHNLTAPEGKFLQTLKEKLTGVYPELLGWLKTCPYHYHEDEFAADSINPRGPQYKCAILDNELHSTDSSSHLFMANKPVQYLGDNHQPWILLANRTGWTEKELNYIYPRKAGEKIVVSVGSVGQPRDGDKRACYVIAADDCITWKRVPYDLDKTLNKVRQMTLAANHYERRLQEGI